MIGLIDKYTRSIGYRLVAPMCGPTFWGGFRKLKLGVNWMHVHYGAPTESRASEPVLAGFAAPADFFSIYRTRFARRYVMKISSIGCADLRYTIFSVTRPIHSPNTHTHARTQAGRPGGSKKFLMPIIRLDSFFVFWAHAA